VCFARRIQKRTKSYVWQLRKSCLNTASQDLMLMSAKASTTCWKAHSVFIQKQVCLLPSIIVFLIMVAARLPHTQLSIFSSWGAKGAYPLLVGTLKAKSLWQWFSAWGREPFLEGSWVDILCTLLHYICFVRVFRWGPLGYSGLL